MTEENKEMVPVLPVPGPIEVYSNRKKLDASVSLFLHESNRLEIEEESCCSAHSTLVSDQNTTFTALKLHGNVMTLKGTKLTEWSANTEIACWYDTFPFSTTPIPLPHHYDEQKRSYVIYGNVCSVECALAYMHREGRHHDLWERIVLFEDMMHTVFHAKIAGSQPAPPFLTLSRFGGFYSIDEFRASFTTIQMTVITPPFIMYPLIIQEKHKKVEFNASSPQVVQKEETVLSTGHVLRGLRRPMKEVQKLEPREDAPLTVEALNVTSDEDENMPLCPATVTPPVPSVPDNNTNTNNTNTKLSGVVNANAGTLNPVQIDKDFFSRLTKSASVSARGRGRGRGRGQNKKFGSGADAPQANPTMLTSFLVVNKK